MERIRYLVRHRYGWYWQPGKSVRALGFSSVPLGKDEKAAQKRAAELNEQVEQERQKIAANAHAPEPGTVRELIIAYKQSGEYADLRATTRRGYDYCLKILDNWAGDSAVETVTAKALKAWYRDLRERTPSKANAVIRVCRLLWKWGTVEGYADSEPARLVRIKGTTPRRALWQPEEVDKLIETSKRLDLASVGLAIRIAFDCTQRQGDVLALTWKQIADGWISFRQSKTGAECEMPLTQELAEALSATKRKGVQVVISEDSGQPYDEHAFRKAFAKVRAGAGFKDRQFMDLRRSGMVEAVHAGVQLRDIAARSGHSIDRTKAILEVYLPATREMNAAAVRKVSEAREQRRNKRV